MGRASDGYVCAMEDEVIVEVVDQIVVMGVVLGA